MSEAPQDLQKGDEVSWKWGQAKEIKGTVAEITAGRAEVTSNKGNTVHRNGTEEDPAVVIERSGNNVVKLAHELNEVDSAKAGK